MLVLIAAEDCGSLIPITLYRRLDKLKELTSLGLHTLELDVTSTESIKTAVDEVLAADGHIDLLVCNAGWQPLAS